MEPGVDVVLQQRARSVLGVAEVVVKHLANREDGIQSDEISEGQRAHGRVGAQFHGLVDVLNSADALIEREHGLVDVGNQDSVGDEAWHVSRRSRLLLHSLRQVQGRREGRLVGLERCDDLDQLHHWHWVHEVHSNHLVRTLWDRTRDLCQRNA